MTATFEVSFGELRCVKGAGRKIIDKTCLADFWEKIGTGNRRGVYVFGIRAGRGWKPLYVGQAKKQTFKRRIAQQTNGNFNDMLQGIRKGTPVLFLIGRIGRGKNSTGAIDELEREVINSAFDRNPHLHNDRGIRRKKFMVKGFGSRGKPAASVRNLKTIIGY